MNGATLILQIEMKSDWHIGTGSGRHGGVDRIVARDDDDLPYLPASTIRNVWRDAAEMLAYGLDEGNDKGDWQALVRSIFGSQPSSKDKGDFSGPKPGHLFVADARFTPALLATLAGKESHALRDALIFIKSGVAIDEMTGTARDDMLRFEEVAIGGALLEATVELTLAPGNADALYWFLAGAAALIERIGGKRRRGLGACEVRLLRSGENAALPKNKYETLRAESGKKLGSLKAPKPSPTKPANGNSTPPKAKPPPGEVDWHQIPIEIKLLSPLIIARNVEGNVVTTLDTIPGSTLLPIVAKAAQAAGMIDVDGRIARGHLRVLPATPVVAGQRGLPTPLAWSKEKAADANRPFAATNMFRCVPDSNIQMKPLRDGFIGPTGQDTTRETTADMQRSLLKTVRTHNVINDETQTPTENIGGVFSYEALVAGQSLRSIVRVQCTGDEANKLRTKLDGTIRLGRAQQVGYGRAKLSSGAISKWMLDPGKPCAGTLTLWLETDALIPGDDLAPRSDLASLAEAVARSIDPTKGTADFFCSSTSRAALRTRSFQSWAGGLPRPSLPLTQAGSVARLTLQPGVTLGVAELQRLQREGIGERRAEGFGVVRINDPLLLVDTVTIADVEPKRDIERPVALSSTSPQETTLLHTVTERAWKRWIVARAEALMSDPEVRCAAFGWKADGSWPNMSQLGGLRSLLPRITVRGESGVSRWLDSQAKKATGKRAAESRTWHTKVHEFVTSPDWIWTVLCATPALPLGMPVPIPDGLKNALWPFAVSTTLLTAMRQHKRTGEQAETRTKPPHAETGARA